MRGTPERQLSMLSSLGTEDLIPADHPIRWIRVVVDEVLAGMDVEFDAVYSVSGRRSVPPEQLLKATVLMAMYSIRSERALCERLNYDILFEWFLDLPIDAKAFDATTFTKNRQRLLEHEIADVFFAAVVTQAKLRCYTSSEYFSVNGTLLQAWASNKSFKPDNPTDGGGDGNGFNGRNAEVDFKGQKRSNATHTSTTDPEAMLFRESSNTAGELCFMGHLLIENRSGLIIDAELTQATGFAERDCATAMLLGSRNANVVAPSPRTRTPTAQALSLRSAGWGSRPMSLRTTTATAPRSMGAPPATPATVCPNGSANASRTLRLDHNRRSRPQGPLQRHRPQPGLVQDRSSGPQPDQNLRPRRCGLNWRTAGPFDHLAIEASAAQHDTASPPNPPTNPEQADRPYTQPAEHTETDQQTPLFSILLAGC